MDPTACTEPQCLYKGALYLTVELYLYSPYGPYGLYRASVPVQGCTLPFFLKRRLCDLLIAGLHFVSAMLNILDVTIIILYTNHRLTDWLTDEITYLDVPTVICIKTLEVILIYGGDDGTVGSLHCACRCIPLPLCPALVPIPKSRKKACRRYPPHPTRDVTPPLSSVITCIGI